MCVRASSEHTHTIEPHSICIVKSAAGNDVQKISIELCI